MSNPPTSLSTKNTTKKKFSFNYFERLHLQKDFNKVFRNGLRLENKTIKILAYKRNDGHTFRRLGLITSKKVGKAVIRNKAKRRLREIFRTNKHLFEPGIDLVFILKPATAKLDYDVLKKDILSLMESAKTRNRSNV